MSANTLPLRIPGFPHLSQPAVQPIELYERWVKGTFIAAYTQLYLNALDPDEFVLTLNRIFQRKAKVFRNLALYVKKEVEEKGHPIQQVLDNIAFFAIVLRDFVSKNCGQPIEGHT